MPSGKGGGLQEQRSELRACGKVIWSRRTARRKGGAVLLNLADGWAPIELLEGMWGATDRDAWCHWLGCARVPAIRQGFGPLRLDAPAGSHRAGKVRAPAALASRRCPPPSLLYLPPLSLSLSFFPYGKRKVRSSTWEQFSAWTPRRCFLNHAY